MTREPDQGDRQIVSLRIDRLTIRSPSTIMARRLAHALPLALERALGTWPDAPVAAERRTGINQQADEVALRVLEAVLARQGGGGP